MATNAERKNKISPEVWLEEREAIEKVRHHYVLELKRQNVLIIATNEDNRGQIP
jgi:hypothetical protein